MFKLFSKNGHKKKTEPPAPAERRVVIDVQDVTKVYKMGEVEVHALRGVSLKIYEGEVVSIMGPSGSGKSTLMNILGCLDQPSNGTYKLDEVDVSAMPESELARIRNKKIGFVFQSFNLLKRTTALRQVELPLIYGSASGRSKKARAALESVGLGQRLDHLPSELSGGQQQRVAIARALVNEPAMILADEPTGNLDSRSGTEVMQIFQRLNREQGITTVFVTHDPWIARHTQRVIMLRDGVIIADREVANPLVAGEVERPSEAEELEGLFRDAYYGGKEEEYN
jgi:putative ABC transport system ATP-binding protein